MKNKIIMYFIVCVCLIVLFAASVNAISADHWAVDYVDFTYNTGIISDTRSGVGETETITRGEFAKGLAEIDGVLLSNDVHVPFYDVLYGTEYAGAVKWANDNGIILGYPNGNFGVNDPITRQDCAVIIYRYLHDHKGIDISTSQTYLGFSDADDIDDYAVEAVTALYYAGIIMGDSEGTYRPLSHSLKMETAVFFTRVHAYRYNSEGDLNFFMKGEAGLALDYAAVALYPYGSTNTSAVSLDTTEDGFVRFTDINAYNTYAVNVFGSYTGTCSDDFLPTSRMYYFIVLPANEEDYDLTVSYNPLSLWPHGSYCLESQWMFPYWCPTRHITSCQNFGWRYLNNQIEFHQGLDYGCVNETVKNTTEYTYTVTKCSYDSSMGRYVRVQMGEESVYFTYQHLSSYSVVQGSTILPNSEFAVTGNTGYGTGYHLHLTAAYCNVSYPNNQHPKSCFFNPRIYF